MHKLIACLLVSLSVSFPAWAMGEKPPEPFSKSSTAILIDNFEDKDSSVNPAWWYFDQISAEVVRSVDRGHTYSLLISGESKGNWYAGGLGCYLARPVQDLSRYNSLQLDIYGCGPEMGNLKVEFYDDDDGNWEITQSTRESFTPLCDDRFSKEIIVDWTGWRTITLPFAEFVDDNPAVGDDIWNPSQLGGSGGLLQLQFICLSSKKTGPVQYRLDNIRLVK